MRILVLSGGAGQPAIADGFRQLTIAMEADATIRNCLLYVPGKASLRNTSLARWFGSDTAQRLERKGAVPLNLGTLSVATDRSFTARHSADAVLVIYADQRMMDKVDDNRLLRLVVCVPHADSAVDAWAATWTPIVFGGTASVQSLLANRIVEAALDSMTVRVNMANRILGPADRIWVKEGFRILRANDQMDDPAAIRIWCLAHGWSTDAADEAERFAQMAFGLANRPSLTAIGDAKATYDRWVEKAKRPVRNDTKA